MRKEGEENLALTGHTEDKKDENNTKHSDGRTGFRRNKRNDKIY